MLEIPYGFKTRKFALYKPYRESEMRFTHPHPSLIMVRLCTSRPYDSFHLVEVEIVEDGGYWGWWKPCSSEGVPEITMIFPSRLLVSTCFPYGPEIIEEHGEGRVVPLAIRSLRALTPEEAETRLPLEAFSVEPA